MIVAFDVDGTLVNFDNTPNYEVIDLLRWFIRHGDRVVIWSGGGQDYARHWAEKLGFEDKVETYDKTMAMRDFVQPDLCFDDEFVQLAKVNVKINSKLTPIN